MSGQCDKPLPFAAIPQISTHCALLTARQKPVQETHEQATILSETPPRRLPSRHLAASARSRPFPFRQHSDFFLGSSGSAVFSPAGHRQNGSYSPRSVYRTEIRCPLGGLPCPAAGPCLGVAPCGTGLGKAGAESSAQTARRHRNLPVQPACAALYS